MNITTTTKRELITLFTGGGGFDEGAKMAGFTPVLGVEMSLEVGLWAEENTPGLRVLWSRVEDVDYSQYETPYHLHASTVCTNASPANSDGEESPEDLSAAQGVCNALVVLRPPCFSLENVNPYRTFQSFKNILGTLHGLGYAFDYWNLNSADYGVPQTRKRLILIARRDRKPTRPVATHTNPANLNGQMLLFGQQLKPWVGWLEAIRDIVDTLPDSEFAPWQEARLPVEFGTFLINGGGNTNYKEAYAGRGCLVPEQPCHTVTAFMAKNSYPKAFLVPGDNTTNGVVRAANEPMVTIQSRSTGQCPHRAFIVGQNYGSPNDTGKERKLNIRQSSEPVFTIETNVNRLQTRAWLEQGRVVRMTPRALARFQSVPDSYLLPDNDKLACTIVGNMVPCLLAKAICESVKE